MPKIITKSELETQKLAMKIAKSLKGGEVLALNGDLGSGKTAFTKGIAKFFDIKKPITSPTFVLMKVYKSKHDKVKNLIHVDTYRLANAQELVDIDMLDYFEEPSTICVLEWAEKVESILPKSTIRLYFSYGKKENERVIEY